MRIIVQRVRDSWVEFPPPTLGAVPGVAPTPPPASSPLGGEPLEGGPLVGRAVERTAHTGAGLLCLVGFTTGDGPALLEPMCEKLIHLRIFEDDQGRMNLSLLDVAGGLGLVSQFTVYADCRKGRRPSFVKALEPVAAEGLFDAFTTVCGARITGGAAGLVTGRFGAEMRVHLINDGPVTLVLDSAELLPTLTRASGH